jgi:ferrous-iron efflux pump FieF
MADGTAVPLSETSVDTQRLMRLATYYSVGVAVFLILAKGTAWLMTGSVALLSSLIDSGLDALASLVNLLAVHHALQPADRHHRFGHGKAEPLAGLGQSAFIIVSALLLVGEAVQRLVEPVPIANAGLGIAVMAGSVVLCGLLVAFQRSVVRRTGSVAIGSDFLHYAGDLALNLSVIVSLILSTRFGVVLADPLFALAIVVFLLCGSAAIAWRSFNLLMDHEFPDADRQCIKTICDKHPEVQSVHDLRTRSSGQRSFIQLHLELDPSMSLQRAHSISDEVEAEIRKVFPLAEVIIHQDPAGIAEPRDEFK